VNFLDVVELLDKVFKFHVINYDLLFINVKQPFHLW
jgi:hypothetical protein